MRLCKSASYPGSNSGDAVGGVESVLAFPFPLSSFALARLRHRGHQFNKGYGDSRAKMAHLFWNQIWV